VKCGRGRGFTKDREAAKQREALHLHSQEVVTKWSNTVAQGQRKKKLEAKKVREQIEEEKRKQMDLEEANYREEKRKEAVQKAELQLYHQTDRVKGLHRALLLTEVLKEREAQMELKQQTKSATERWEKEILEKIMTREDEAMKQQEEKTLKKRRERMAFAEDLKNETQQHREGILDKVVVTQQERMLHEEQRTAKAAEEMDARRGQLQQEEEQKKAAMLKSITEHREFIRHQHVMTEERKFAEKNVQLTAEEEKRFQEYSQQVIDAAAEAKKMLFPLYKAARKGNPPEDGPASRGVQPTCLVQDVSGAVMPRIVTRKTEKIKKLHEAADINQAKRRLGFTW
uniref:Cilia and flagella associated protein 210 n=1 Tax=Oryzias latipes TaxID=8090 RepID=A0A3B3HU48_ORYLA